MDDIEYEVTQVNLTSTFPPLSQTVYPEITLSAMCYVPDISASSSKEIVHVCGPIGKVQCRNICEGPPVFGIHTAPNMHPLVPGLTMKQGTDPERRVHGPSAWNRIHRNVGYVMAGRERSWAQQYGPHGLEHNFAWMEVREDHHADILLCSCMQIRGQWGSMMWPLEMNGQRCAFSGVWAIWVTDRNEPCQRVSFSESGPSARTRTRTAYTSGHKRAN
ncbi:hypothetical protein P175DRAFT_0561299 [Aspergillus ochraceoroseus IBT 24754]|uniref:Uncharacterized protein n=1 Tax=Aspergillus ochraceoroseus IBT 24754 TaxID=1392256 RepID=A0A2T5LKR4_9EURO|nr:uncharacterized protein P175DRAFT_0561299 [Aspergillus ochraceoroseus IBT 24754]PTU16876.1 hypothetical protein P175DRAFT_0561299 [Aspergillus ochraceoroseus IBT 24754]